MALSLEQIVEETRHWPEEAVAELLDRIALAKHGGLVEERAEAWRAEAARRSAELQSGAAPLVPGPDVSARVAKLVGA